MFVSVRRNLLAQTTAFIARPPYAYVAMKAVHRSYSKQEDNSTDNQSEERKLSWSERRAQRKAERQKEREEYAEYVQHRRKELKKELYGGLYPEISEISKTGSKIFKAANTLTPVNSSLLFPQGLLNGPIVDLTGAEANVVALARKRQATLITIGFVEFATEMLGEWASGFRNEFPDDNSAATQVLELSISERWLFRKLFFPNMIAKNIRSATDESLHSTTLLHFGEASDFRSAMNITNTRVGWVFLLDKQGKVRWSAVGVPTFEEMLTMKLLTYQLLGKDSSHLTKDIDVETMYHNFYSAPNNPKLLQEKLKGRVKDSGI